MTSVQTINALRVLQLWSTLEEGIRNRLKLVAADAAKQQRPNRSKRRNKRDSSSERDYDSDCATDVDSIDDGCFRTNTITGQGGLSVEVSEHHEFTHKVQKVADPLPLEVISTDQIVALEQGSKEIICGTVMYTYSALHNRTALPDYAKCSQERNICRKVVANHLRETKQGTAADSS